MEQTGGARQRNLRKHFWEICGRASKFGVRVKEFDEACNVRGKTAGGLFIADGAHSLPAILLIRHTPGAHPRRVLSIEQREGRPIPSLVFAAFAGSRRTTGDLEKLVG